MNLNPILNVILIDVLVLIIKFTIFTENSLTPVNKCLLKKTNHYCSFENIKNSNVETLLVALGRNMCKISGK